MRIPLDRTAAGESDAAANASRHLFEVINDVRRAAGTL